MDNNSAPQPIQPNSQVPQNPEGSSKMVLWLITGLIITIFIVGAVYWYLSSQQSKQMESSTALKSAQTKANLEKDLNSIVVPDVYANFAEVDKDLGNL